MRHLVILIFLTVVLGCQGITKYISNDYAIVGSWKLVGMSKTPVEVDKVPQDGKIGGTMDFKSDKTYESKITVPGIFDEGIKTSGTYKVEGDILTTTNKENTSTTKSKIRFEKDYLIISSTDASDTSTMYYKRVN